MIAVQIRVHQVALVGRGREVIVNLVEQKPGEYAPAPVAGSTRGSQCTDDVAAPDRRVRAISGVDLAQRGTQLGGGRMLPLASAPARLTPRGAGQPRGDDIRPAPARLEQGHQPVLGTEVFHRGRHLAKVGGDQLAQRILGEGQVGEVDRVFLLDFAHQGGEMFRLDRHRWPRDDFGTILGQGRRPRV